MKVSKLSLIATLAFASASLVVAQETPPAAPGAGPRGAGGRGAGFSPAQRIERMDTELKLTAEQKTKLTSFYEEQQKKMQALRQDTSLTQEARREKATALREEETKQMKEILTSEQLEKWEKQRAAMRQRVRAGGPGGPGGAPAERKPEPAK